MSAENMTLVSVLPKWLRERGTAQRGTRHFICIHPRWAKTVRGRGEVRCRYDDKGIQCIPQLRFVV